MATQGFYIRQWSCVNSRARPGDKVLLKKTGRGLVGILASGTILSVPYEDQHWNQSGENKQYVHVKFDRLADYTEGQIFPTADKVDFGFVPQASGCLLEDSRAQDLMQRWQAYIATPTVQPKPTIPAKKNRAAISMRLRWVILDRDAHTCRYCGRSAPSVVLQVDHIISQKNWRLLYDNLNGVNDESNLTAACFDCNNGKRDGNGNLPLIAREVSPMPQNS